MFESARLKLTAWYLVIIMAVSLLFSFAIYSSINFEFQRFERMEIRFQEDIDKDHLPIPTQNRFFRIGHPDPEMIENFRRRLLLSLGLINFAILIIAGTAGYFLAGRTLKPIKKMVDEQKRFITDASHELRTPITSLRSETEVALRNKHLTLTDAKKLLESNLEEAINLQALSDNLLELAQNGKLVDSKHLQKVSLQEVIDTAIKKVEPLGKNKQIAITNQVKKIFISGMPDRLIEVFVILFDNAIKYSDKKSNVLITAKKDTDTVTILVKDGGIGISSDDLPHIFQRFYRASKSRTKNEVGGYGLGLSIAKKIVEGHGGTISAESKPKQGSTFKLVFRLITQNKT